MISGAVQGRRETGKQARRQALLDVARSILADGDLSMRQLADQAGVAHATPYNLFGSKRELIAALYVDQRERLEARLETAAPDPLMRLFAAIDLIADDLDRQPHFHRALYRAVYRVDTTISARHDEADPGVHFWMAQIAAIKAANLLHPTTRVDLYARCAVNIITGAMLDWTEGRVEAPEWSIGVRYGLALLTLPLATADARASLKRIIADLEENGDQYRV